MEEKIAFGKYISEKRKGKGLTQKALAEQLYISESAVSKWERGKSYPDITLVTSICQLLDITEHELITASDDENQRLIVQQANTLKRLVQRYHLFFGMVYGAILVACFIGDLVVDGHIDWFFIALASVLIGASLISVPVIVKDNKGWWTLLSFTVSLILMYGICNLYFKENWFFIASLATLLSEGILFLPALIKKQNTLTLLKKHKAASSYILNSGLLLLLVYFVSLEVGAMNILWTRVYPSVFFGLAYGGLLIGIVSYTPFNAFIKWGLSLLLSGLYMIITNPILTYFIDGDSSLLLAMRGQSLSHLLNHLDLNGFIGLVLSLLSLCFLIGGIVISVIQHSKYQEKMRKSLNVIEEVQDNE